MKQSFAAILAATALGCSAQALTISISADVLKSQDGTAMPTTGLVLLTALTTGTDFGPTAGSFTGAGELLLGKWDLSAIAPGMFSGITDPLSFTGDWNEGDPLRLYWFPTLTLDSLAPGAGTFYGSYTDLIGVDGSAPWITGSESSNLDLQLFTEDSTIVPGSVPASAGSATSQVASAHVPDNGSTLVMFGAVSVVLLGMASRRGPRLAAI